MSCVTCDLLPGPVTNATATEHPPANFPTMHTRLDPQDRNVYLGELVNFTPKLKENLNQKPWFKTSQKKGFIVVQF